MAFVKVLWRFCNSICLKKLSVSQIMRFLWLSSCLKHDILLPQPIAESSDSSKPPGILPSSVHLFLSDAIGVPVDEIDHCWDVLKDEAWNTPSPEDLKAEDMRFFQEYGWKRGLTFMTVYPPNTHCLNERCSRIHPLKKEQQQQVVIYTQVDGVQPAWSIQMTCPECSTNYHNNFSICDGVRTYHEGFPHYLQVGDHQFVEMSIVGTWTGAMVNGWVSAWSCAKLYNQTMGRPTADIFPNNWQFGTTLTGTHIPHVRNQDERFMAVMQERNERIILEGQDEMPHYCDLCMRVYQNEDGSWSKCQVVVCDGLSMGHPCGTSFRCTTALQKNSHRFCPLHSHLNFVCSIQGCDLPCVTNQKSCTDHLQLEDLHFACGQAAFKLAHHYNVAKRAAGKDIDEKEIAEELYPVEEDGDIFEIQENHIHLTSTVKPPSVGVVDDLVPCDSKSETRNHRLKAHFNRSRTHNEEVLTCPCGVILARSTFFGAEAVSNVLLFIKNTFSVPGAHKLEHLIFDTNCDAKQQVDAHPDTDIGRWFQDVGMCVDVFHFLNKHKVTHTFCQENCNPAMYPELLGDDKKNWFFNTSVSEQINVWLGKFQPICREMNVVKYNFFLDEMIRLHNIDTVAELQAQGANPCHAPPS
ncbi:hypothetical protein C8J56DRAFT_1065320 [Mycena floridula]|nr:hypothetical protein C8J56DRAFT_1065320 [Mycena floridula]